MRRGPKQVRRVLSTLVILTVTAGTVMAGGLTGAGQAADAGATATTGVTAAVTAAACPGQSHGWAAAPPPSPGTGNNSLADVAVLPPCEAWAVGTAVSHGVTQTLTEHWDGSAWAVVPSPDPGRDSFLTSVRATSPASVWAVGYFTSGNGHRTLILHWSGSRWERVPSPSPGGGSELFGVRVVSAHDAWAVGTSSQRSGDRTLILHWNGTTWRQLPSPSPGRTGSNDDLFSVTATSPRDAWAVGYIFRLPRIRTLILHWDGRRWSHVASPSPGSDAELFSVAATSRRNAWAVGPVTHSKTFVLHWDGQRWKRMATPNQGGAGNGNTLEAVTATSARNAWAVGFYFFRGAAHHTLVLHWNGTRWVHQRTPVQGDSSSLFGVGASSADGASSAGGAWAVGRFNTGGPSRAAALHCCAQAAPATATPLPVLYNLGGSNTASWNLPQRRPSIFLLAADGSAYLGSKAHPLKWSRWTMTSAAATGRYHFRNGPCCKYHSRSVKITANHVRHSGHRRWYDRMTIRFSRSRAVTLQYKRAGGLGFWDMVSGRFP